MGIAFLTQTPGNPQFSLASITYFVKLVTKVPKRSSQKVVLLQKSKRELRNDTDRRVGVRFVPTTRESPQAPQPARVLPLKTTFGWVRSHRTTQQHLGSIS
jgi:hypothetical protein